LNEGAEQTELQLPWRSQPGDQTASYLEIWMPGTATEIRVSVRPPGGNEVLHFDAESPEGLLSARLLSEDGSDLPGRVVARMHGGMVGGRLRFVMAVAPTACLDPVLAVAPHGIWDAAARATIPAGDRIEAWFQRDTSPIRARIQGRQSYFDDPHAARFDARGRALKDDPQSGGGVVEPGVARDRRARKPVTADDPSAARGVVGRRCTLNGIATGGRAIIVAGYPVTGESDGAAPYSATGFGEDRNPSVAAPSDRSRVLGGILAAGTLSGTSVAINGTSAAAPAVARRIALHALAPGSGPPPIADKPRPVGRFEACRVGAGWLLPSGRAPTRQTQGSSDLRVRLRRDGSLIASGLLARVVDGPFRRFSASVSAVRRIPDRLVLTPSAAFGPGTGCRARTA
jgi:hypothetical protein